MRGLSSLHSLHRSAQQWPFPGLWSLSRSIGLSWLSTTNTRLLCLEMNQSHRWASRGVPPSVQRIPERWFNGDLLACLIQIPESSRELLEKFKAVPWRVVRWGGRLIEGWLGGRKAFDAVRLSVHSPPLCTEDQERAGHWAARGDMALDLSHFCWFGSYFHNLLSLGDSFR